MRLGSRYKARMRRTRSLCRWIAVVLLYCMMPGVGEVVENLDHLILEGHFAHAQASHRQDSRGEYPEHGCNGTFHLCSCHITLSFLTPAGIALVGALPPGSLRGSADSRSPGAGYHQIPERPPCA